ncbi:MAG: baseplate J/gp47 family protein [Ktedonobacteraceae bacterium]
MPLTIPTLDDRRFQDLLDEALARIPVHNPEWLNYNKSDPGVTLIELFAFLTETLLYRSNRIPENNRRKFLTLLGINLQAASSAGGLVEFTNERGPLQTITLNDNLEVRAGQVPFRTEKGLAVLPIEAQVYYKHKVDDPTGNLMAYYQQLFASFMLQSPDRIAPLAAMPLLYETVPFTPRGTNAIDLSQDTIDSSLWIALMVRSSDNGRIEEAREAIGGKTVSLGVVPSLADASRQLLPGVQPNPERAGLLQYSIPVGGSLPANRQPQYKTLEASSPTDILIRPGVVEITLPGASELKLWDNLEPLEAGVGDLPPALDDTTLNDRIITWLRVSTSPAARARLLWIGINTTFVTQRAHVFNELLPSGSGEPDQIAVLAKTPVIPASVQITVNGKAWQEIDDLLTAGSEVPTTNLRQPPGAPPSTNPLAPVQVFTVDPESGTIRFGDGLHGARPPFDATIRADYAYGVGSVGNVGPGTITSSPVLPSGIKVNNPVRTWGGAEAETVSEGEKQISRYLQHRDRLVNATDFKTITLRTPGVDIGRVEVLPAFNPELTPNEPGDAPGTVTLMVIPKYDLVHPDTPSPDLLFLDAICSYLDTRRLVTTEVLLRGPVYKPIWISVGINVIAGFSIAQVREAVKKAFTDFLSPLPDTPGGELDSQTALLTASQSTNITNVQKGWPLRKSVAALELLAVASRVLGVLSIRGVLLAEGNSPPADQVAMNGLELPRVAGLLVTVGDPVGIDQLRGQGLAQPGPGGTFVPVPIIPEECK